jgi:putative ABC transport system permease protein
MARLLQDIRYGVRMLAKNPGFTVVAVLTLALGIGANTAIFSVVQRVLLRALPYQNPESLVQISNTYFPMWPELGLSPGDFQDWRRDARSFSGMAAYVEVARGFNLTGEGEPQRIQATFATSALFPLLGVRPAAGRAFVPEEDKAGSAPVVMLSHRFWESRFGSDPAVVGRTISLDGKRLSLVGVLPAGFPLAAWADLWMPAGQYQDDLTGRVHHPFTAIARLKPGITISQAQAELLALNKQSGISFPDTHKNWGVIAKRMEDPAATKMRRALLVLFAAVGFVLLIACANIVNLLLARNASRQKEIALRIALGASRVRLVSQLLTESVLLSLLGGALGLLLAATGLSVADKFVPPDFAGVRLGEVNGWVLGFTIAVCFLAGVVCGLIPALQTLKTDLHGVLKEGGRTSRGSGGQRVRHVIVVSQVALALIPLAGAGLLIRSFHRLLAVDPGFQPDHILAMEVDQPTLSLEEINRLTPAEQQNFGTKQSLEFEQVATRIEGLPGVKRVGGVDVLPLGSSTVQASRFLVEGQPVPSAGARPVAEVRTASLGYFGVIGIPLLQGRTFTQEDWALTNVVINRTMAQRFWPGGAALGKRVNVCTLDSKPCFYSVVGVVGDVHQYGLDTAPSFDIYFTGGWTPYFVIRTASDASSVAQAAIREVHQVDPNLPVTHIVTLDDILSESVSPRRFSTVLLGIFAVLALALAAIGIYGVMSYVVSWRTQEIGIRMALGAQPRDVLNLVVGRGARLAFAGVAIGLAGALALTHLLAGLLYGVGASDPLTFTGVALLLAFVALLACYIPARRAMRVDPMIALRHE